MKSRSKFSKQILSLVLALVMVFGMLPMTAFAAESDFVFADGTITGYNGTDTELVIPSTIGGVAVTTIGTSAFANNKNITSVVIPEDIKVMEWKDESGNLVTTLPETMPDDGAGETDQAIIYTTDAVYVDYYTVTATANPTEGGSVSGGGEFAEGATVTLIASSNDGYTFVNWTENGIEVSTDAEYAFTVSADRELVANFEAVSTEHKHALNGGEELTWTAITKLSEITGPGNYYIDGTLELDYYDRTINPSGTVNLCLNGASIDYKYAVTVNEGTTLNICDCGGSNITFTIENSGTTNIYSGNFGKRIENYNTLNIYGGSFVTEEYAGSIHNYSGTLTIYDGTIKNNGGHAVENDGGEIIIFDGDFEATKCCVNNDDGTLTIHKGTYISTGSYATIDVDGGSATIKDGTYQNGTSVVVRIYNSGESLIIEDGDFTGNGEVANGTAGVLDIRGGTFTTTGNEKNILIASGTVKVSGGTFTSGNQAWIKRYESGSFQLSGGTFKGGLRLNLDNPSAGGPVLPESLVEGYGYYQNGQHYKFTEGVNKQIITGGDVTVKKSTESYTVTVEETTNGTVEADKATADVGDTVTLTVTPGEGYVLDTLIVKQGENPVEVKTDYSFTMPDGDVIVTATFTSCDHSGSEHETATDNGDGTHDFTCSICRNTEEESHNFDSTTGLCSGCKIQMAVASVTVSANTTYYETLGEAVTAAGVGTESVPATLTLLVDIDLGSSYQRIDSGTFTLDLNGKTLSSSSDSMGLFSESNVTIADSSAAGTGKIIGGDNGLYIENATVTVVGGAIDGYYGVNAKSAIVTINGGTISGKTGVYIDNGEVAITGGTVEGENIGVQATANSEVEISGEAVVKSDRHIESMVSTGVHAADSTVTINGGQISGEKGVYVENSTVTVTGGAVEGEYEGVYAEADSEVKISGGQVGGVDGVYVESSTAIVTGGTFNNNEDCVEAKNSTVTISGGVLTGECGVYVCGSVANITGGTIESTFYGVYADENSEVEIGSDAVVKGGSVLDDYVRAGGFVKGNSVLTVKGGQLGGTFGVYAKGGTINIDGGIIAADYYGAWAKEGSVLNISGGAVTCDAYGVVSYDSTVAVSGANISGNYGLYVEGGGVTLSGGSISGTYNDIVHYENTVKLILPEGKTQGTTFPDGISVYGTPLVELLGEGAAYWQGNKQISPTTKQLEIADGTVTIQAPCNHSGNTNDDYIDNGDGTHSLSCTVCDKLAVTGEHTGGEATCVDKAVCGTCGASYGETASNAHDLIYTTNDRTNTVFLRSSNCFWNTKCICNNCIAIYSTDIFFREYKSKNNC